MAQSYAFSVSLTAAAVEQIVREQNRTGASRSRIINHCILESLGGKDFAVSTCSECLQSLDDHALQIGHKLCQDCRKQRVEELSSTDGEEE